MNKSLSTTLSLATILLGSQAFAEFEPPRGMNVEPLAGNCGIGPFGQTSKAGMYNHLCETMPEAEKCLALVKWSFWGFDQSGQVEKTHSPEKLEYCLEAFRRELIQKN